LIFFLIDYESTSIWFFNIHRFVGIISVIFLFIASYQIFILQNKSKLLLLFLPMLCILVLGADYMFFFSCYILLLVSTYLFKLKFNQKNFFNFFIKISLLFIFVFVLRQLQVISGVGWDIYFNDLIFQLLNRLSLENFYVGNFSIDSSNFYNNYQIQNPGLNPSINFNELLISFFNSFGFVINKYILFNTFSNYIHQTIIGILFVFLSLILNIKLINQKNIILINISIVNLSYLFSTIIGTLIFQRYYIQWLPSYNFCVYLIYCNLILFFLYLYNFNKYTKNISLIIMFIFLLIRLNIFLESFDNKNISRINFEKNIENLSNSRIATNFIPESTSSYTRSFSTYLSNDGIIFLSENNFIHPGSRFLFNEKDQDNLDFLLPTHIVIQNFNSEFDQNSINLLLNSKNLILMNNYKNSYYVFKIIQPNLNKKALHNVLEKNIHNIKKNIREKLNFICEIDKNNKEIIFNWNKVDDSFINYYVIEEKKQNQRELVTLPSNFISYKIKYTEKTNYRIKAKIGTYEVNSEYCYKY